MEACLMKTVLVTGAKGFIGRNLLRHLAARQDVRVIGLDVDNSREELVAAVSEADFIMHLAGVNRPKDVHEFETGNRGASEDLVELLEAQGRQVPVLLSSSIQAELDNPYGISKRGAEAAFFEYGTKNDAPVFVFRLPNVFGKWCRPNYNSVVATWCHNTANGLPIQINDPATSLKLVYIDDVIAAFIGALDGQGRPEADGYCRVPVVYVKSLGEIAGLLEGFIQSRRSLVMPSLEDDFVRKLYGTWLSYLPVDGFAYPLEMKNDNRGWLAEFIKSASFGQVFVSKTKPGITRGNHWHHTKVEKFLVVSGTGLVRFRQVDGTAVLEYPVSGDQLSVVDIPVGYTHSITNTGTTEMVTIFWADEIFNPGTPDTYFLEV